MSLVKVNRLFAFYQLIKSFGYEHVKDMPTTKKSTFNRNIADLTMCGLSRSVLQNLHTDTGAQVLPLARVIKVDFSRQLPADYSEPADLWAA